MTSQGLAGRCTSPAAEQTERPMPDESTAIGDLMALMDASVRQGRAVESGDEIGAGLAYRDALACFGRLLARIDPDGAANAEALMARARETTP